MWSYARKVLESLSLKAIAQRLDKRKLQHDIDVHRLFLLTSYHSRLQTAQGGISGTQLAEEIAAAAEKMQVEELKKAVEANLMCQVRHISSCLHSILLLSGDPTEPAEGLKELASQRRQSSAAATTSSRSPGQKRRRGLAAAVGGGGGGAVMGNVRGGAARTQVKPVRQPTRENDLRSHSDDQLPQRFVRGAEGQQNLRLSMAELSHLLQEKSGYALHISPSAQSGGDSGEGLWLKGGAPLGSVVALYPGLVYTPLMYRRIPGYPRIDRGNDYLMARFDGAVLDAQPWGRGDAVPLPPSTVHLQTHTMARWQQQLETRHPLALAHFANHPSKGCEPNVMVAAFDYAAQPDEGAWVRAYIPNVMFCHEHEEAQISDPEKPVPGLALVATRPIQDEEILLNYRLSTHVARPAWYKPVDEQEDTRRWA